MKTQCLFFGKAAAVLHKAAIVSLVVFTLHSVKAQEDVVIIKGHAADAKRILAKFKDPKQASAVRALATLNTAGLVVCQRRSEK